MELLNKKDTLILNKNHYLPERGIICAHPDRAKRIAEEFFDRFDIHTDYRGFQVYTGHYQQQPLFVANTGIGAPAAAFLIEELLAFGVKRILRLGSNDSAFTKFKVHVVEETTLPRGLCEDYDFPNKEIKISPELKHLVDELARAQQIPYEFMSHHHIDGYYAQRRSEKRSQDMESGALYLLSRVHSFECLSILISYPKHETRGEYKDEGRSKSFENQAIKLALELIQASKEPLKY